MITQKSIEHGAWTVLTTAGQDASCWLDEDNDGAGGTVDVRIVHSNSGEPAITERTKGKRAYKPSGNSDIMELWADDASDIFYATCMNSGATALLSVDAE